MKRTMPAVLSMLLIGAVACSSKPEAKPSIPASSPSSSRLSIPVKQKDFSIQLGATSGPAGAFSFNISNQGPSVHEFVVFRTDLPEAALPQKSGLVDEKGSGLELVDEQEDIANGTTAQLNVGLTEGNYVMICNIVGHYQAGMHAAFGVTKPASSTSVGASQKDFSITLDRSSGPEGAFDFSIKNSGPSVHEFVIFQTDLATDKLPVKSGVVNEEASGLKLITEKEDIKVNASVPLPAALVRGRYVLICNIAGHYQAGMRTEFNVT